MVIARGAGPMKSVRLCTRSCRLEVELEAAWCCWYYRLRVPNCAVGARVGRVQAKMTGYETRYSEFDVQHIPNDRVRDKIFRVRCAAYSDALAKYSC